MRGYQAQRSALMARRAAQQAQHEQRMQRMSAAAAGWQKRVDGAHNILDRAAQITQRADSVRVGKPSTARPGSSWNFFGTAPTGARARAADAIKNPLGLLIPGLDAGADAMIGKGLAGRLFGRPRPGTSKPGVIARAVATAAAQPKPAIKPTPTPKAPTPAEQISAKLAQAKAVLATGDTKAAADMTFDALQLYKAADKGMLPSESMQVLTELNQMTTQIETVKAQQVDADLATLDDWSAEDDAALFDGLLDEPAPAPFGEFDPGLLADLEAADDDNATVVLDEAEEIDDAWAAELADIEANLYDKTGIEFGTVTPTAGAVFDLEEELAWELLGEQGDVGLEAAAMLLPEAPTHDPRGRPGPGAGGSSSGGGMSDLEASRRAFDMIRSVEAEMSGPLDGFADDVMDLAGALADDRAELAAAGQRAGAMSSRPFMQSLMGEADSLLAEADRMLAPGD